MSAIPGLARGASRWAFPAALLACVGCDQATKQAAGLLLESSQRLTLFGDMLRFELVANPGAFMSLGAGLPELVRRALLVGLAPALLTAVCLVAVRTGRASRLGRVALGLVVGGGLGNWLDRVLHGGAVTDFVSIGVGRFRTGIFNVADVAIVAGVLLLMTSGRRAPSMDAAREDA
ncbi:MAG TPA: signal peptidase II [Myxococcota bacterium]|nr:signal peptidase II [Myxococcota bacterium]